MSKRDLDPQFLSSHKTIHYDDLPRAPEVRSKEARPPESEGNLSNAFVFLSIAILIIGFVVVFIMKFGW